MLTLHLNAIKEHGPRAIIATRKEVNGEPSFTEEELKGDWWRVFPSTGHDVFYLMDLEQHLDKFAPASGGGVLVHPRAMPLTFKKD